MAMVTAVLGALLLLIAPFGAAGDVFCDNLKLVATALPKNTSSSPVHFATTAFGQAPDVVYALALCSGDVVNSSACGECVATTFQKMLNWTPPPEPPDQCYKAFSYYGYPCGVFYSTNDIIAPSSNDTAEEPFVKWNANNVTGDVDLIVGLTQRLLEQTVERAANAAPKRFATGVLDSGTDYPLVYSLAQCTPDLSPGNCSACLRRLLGMVNTTMAMRMGAQIQVIRCYFRYEAYQFYSSQPMLRLDSASAPAPAPTLVMEKPKRSFSKLWAIPIVLVPLAAGTCLCFILYSRRKNRQTKGMPTTCRKRTNWFGKGRTQSSRSLSSIRYWRLQITFRKKTNLGEAALALSTRASFLRAWKWQLKDFLRIRDKDSLNSKMRSSS